MLHAEASTLAGKTLKLKEGRQFQPGVVFTVEDWYDRLFAKSWKALDASTPSVTYAWRVGAVTSLLFHEDPQYFVPHDDEVLFGKINGVDALVNIYELDLESHYQST